jgi:excisionase family DNA binding protein
VAGASAAEFSFVFSDEPVARRSLNRSQNATLCYSTSGELVRMEVKDARPVAPIDDAQIAVPLREAAQVLGLHPATLRRLAARGELRTLRIGSQWLTTVAWVEEFRKKRRGPGRPRKTA